MASWRQIVKQVAYWTVPAGFLNIARTRLHRNSVYLPSLSAEESAILAHNKELRNRHLGERCFILATGPSIKTQDLKALQGETCIAVSNFFVHPDYHLIAPRYHCMAAYHPPITEEGWIAWMKEAAAKTGDSTFFFALSDLKRHQDAGVGAGRSVHYLHCGRSSASRQHGVDLTKPIFGPVSVPVMALQVALYMGFKRIYLLGCDHDWILHMNRSSHFYEEEQHALVRNGYNEWFNFDWETDFAFMAALWRQYKTIRLCAESCSAEIYNATPGGLLDVFPRVRYESLFVGDNPVSSSD